MKGDCRKQAAFCVLLFFAPQLSEGIILVGFSQDVSTHTPNTCLSLFSVLMIKDWPMLQCFTS